MYYKKVIFAVLLIVFIYVQLAESLTCYKCSTESDCKKPEKQVCNNFTANEIRHQLETYHQNVPNITGSIRFDCLKLKYTSGKKVTHLLHGCVHPAVAACSLQLKPMYVQQNWVRSNCLTCSGEKCNKSPAGTYSSSFYTILATALTLMLAKLFT